MLIQWTEKVSELQRLRRVGKEEELVSVPRMDGRRDGSPPCSGASVNSPEGGQEPGGGSEDQGERIYMS